MLYAFTYLGCCCHRHPNEQPPNRETKAFSQTMGRPARRSLTSSLVVCMHYESFLVHYIAGFGASHSHHKTGIYTIYKHKFIWSREWKTVFKLQIHFHSKNVQMIRAPYVSSVDSLLPYLFSFIISDIENTSFTHILGSTKIIYLFAMHGCVPCSTNVT